MNQETEETLFRTLEKNKEPSNQIVGRTCEPYCRCKKLVHTHRDIYVTHIIKLLGWKANVTFSFEGSKPNIRMPKPTNSTIQLGV